MVSSLPKWKIVLLITTQNSEKFERNIQALSSVYRTARPIKIYRHVTVKTVLLWADNSIPEFRLLAHRQNVLMTAFLYTGINTA